MANEFIIYADESEQHGDYYSHFFGGVLVNSKDLLGVQNTLTQIKQENNLFQEIKWTKVTGNYLEKYKIMMDAFFGLVRQNKIKTRIMFSDNRNIPVGLTSAHKDHEYFLLYYQFIKHAFGLRHACGNEPIKCRLLLDELPDTREKIENFKCHLANISVSKEFRGKITIQRDQIVQVRSHDHVILQCLDVVLGSMAFRLNQRHKIKQEGQRTRGKRTIAKEKLYKHILEHIQSIYPNFNIGITTGKQNGMTSTWLDPYRHWVFVPQHYQREEKNKTPFALD